MAENHDVQAGGAARERLLDAALEVFAERGYGKASTREICARAGANVAAIHYYFGDKASLYRTVFDKLDGEAAPPPALDDPGTSLEDGLRIWYQHLMAFVLARDEANHGRLLVLREQMQPSGALATTRTGMLGRYHEQLLRFLSIRLEIDPVDTRLQQLAFSLIGIAMVLIVERGTIRRLAPDLVDSEEAVAASAARLLAHAQDLIDGERERRRSDVT
ncbi:MAG: CerR family C-terminal domain-containing protein [Pseudomonadales bacterium]